MIMNKKAFSLVELSITIFIIGLFVVSVSAGSKIIEKHKLKSVYSEVSKIAYAIEQFDLNYNALPGDLHNAHFYFGDACGSNSPAPNGCNGNGDKTIQDAEFNSYTRAESFRFWQHLQLAGLIDGQFSGVIGEYENGYHNSENSYNSNYMDFDFIVYYSWRASQLYSHLHPRNNFIMDNPTYADESWKSLDDVPFTIKEIYDLDSKFDDGSPVKGMINIDSGVYNGYWQERCLTYTGRDADGKNTWNWYMENTTGCKIILNGKLFFD